MLWYNSTKTATKGIGKGEMSRRLAIVLFLAYPLLWTLLFICHPLISVAIDSLYSMTYTQVHDYVGIDNYVTVLTNSSYNQAILNSVYYMLAAIVQVTLSLVLALIICDIKHSVVYRVCLTVPYFINGIAIGYIFKLFYTHGYVLDTILHILGFGNLPYWLRDQSINNFSLMFASVWRYTGLSLIVFIGAILSIDRKLYEIADLYGANELDRFHYIIWPAIRRVFLIVMFLSIVSSLSEFELPYAITAGGSNGTATYMTLIYHIAFTERKVGIASAMTVLLLLQIIVFSCLLYGIWKIIERCIGNKQELERNA